ncbi:MAG: response regulator transcription factor [Clostridia bacterium]|nr:response regulator transcription factor [Clostridia bacterium]
MFTILVVEDDFGTRKLMSVILRNGGYTAITAENSESALRLFEEEHPDLVLADVMLPDASGFRLTEAIRKKDPDVPIIIVTAKQSQSDKHYGFIVGADDYMTKPVDDEELLLRIKALLRRAKSASEQKLVFGALTLDYSTLSATVDGKTADLTQKEFLVLFKLLSSPNKIFTRNEILEDVWGTTVKDDHTLNVHINRIREKLGALGFYNAEIKSVRGLGYKAVINDD